jgi:hypothetical protein
MIKARSIVNKVKVNQVKGIKTGTFVGQLFDNKVMAVFRKLGNWPGLRPER